MHVCLNVRVSRGTYCINRFGSTNLIEFGRQSPVAFMDCLSRAHVYVALADTL